MTNNRSKNNIEISKGLYLKGQEINLLSFFSLGLTGIVKIPSIRIQSSKIKNSPRLFLKPTCILTKQSLVSSKTYKMNRMVYKFMLNTSKINGVRVAKR